MFDMYLINLAPDLAIDRDLMRDLLSDASALFLLPPCPAPAAALHAYPECMKNPPACIHAQCLQDDAAMR